MAVPNGLNHRYGATGSYPVGIEYAESERMSVFICGICEFLYGNGLHGCGCNHHLLANAESINNSSVTCFLHTTKVVEQSSSPTHQL